MILRRNSRRRNRSGVKPRRHFCDRAGKYSFVRRRKVCRQGRCDIAFLSMRRTLSTARRCVERLPSRNAAISSILPYNTVRINVEVSVPAVFTARRSPEGGSAATSFVRSCAAFQSMPRGNVEVSVPAVSMARRTPEGGSAATSFFQSCAAFQSMPRGNDEVSVPAVSMAWRLVVCLPSRNAARLSSESCTAFQSMPRG